MAAATATARVLEVPGRTVAVMAARAATGRAAPLGRRSVPWSSRLLALPPRPPRCCPPPTPTSPPPSCGRGRWPPRSLGFSGYAESAGSLALPVTDQLSSVADLFSDRTRCGSGGAARPTTASTSSPRPGRPARTADAGGTWTLGVRDGHGHPHRRQPARPARPAGPAAAARWAAGCCPRPTDGELSRIGARRVAGRDALGLRLTPGRRGRLGAPRRRLGRRGDAGCRCRCRCSAKGAGPAGAGHPVPRPGPRRARRRRSPPSPRRPARRPGGPRGRGGAARPAGRIRAGPAARTSWPGCPAAALEGVPPGIGLYGSGVTLLAVAPVPGRPGRRRCATRCRRARTPSSTSWARGSPPVRWALMLVEPPGSGPLRADRHGHPRRAGRRRPASCPTWSGTR